MECSACLATCKGGCQICKGLCGSGKPKKVCLTEKEFVGEHKHLIGLLSEVGKEGRKQAKELRKVTGKGELNEHPMAPVGKSLEQVMRWHYNMGHTLEDLLIHQDGPNVIYNLFWKPSAATANKLNKLFSTFKFHTNGTLSAIRGRAFARDAEILIRMMNKEELNDDDMNVGMGHCQSSHAKPCRKKPSALITWQPARPPKNPKPANVVVNPMNISTLPPVVPSQFHGITFAESGKGLGKAKQAKKLRKGAGDDDEKDQKNETALESLKKLKMDTKIDMAAKRLVEIYPMGNVPAKEIFNTLTEIIEPGTYLTYELEKSLRDAIDKLKRKMPIKPDEPDEETQLETRINEVAKRFVAKYGHTYSGPEKYKALLEIEPDPKKLTYELENRFFRAMRKIPKSEPQKKTFSPIPEEEYITIAKEIKELNSDDSELAELKKIALEFDEKMSSLLFTFKAMETAKVNNQPPHSILKLAIEVLEKIHNVPESLAQKYEGLTLRKRGRALETLDREAKEAQVFRKKVLKHRNLFQATPEFTDLKQELGLTTDNEVTVLAAVTDRAMKTYIYYTQHPEAAEKRYAKSIGKEGLGRRRKYGGVKLVRPPIESKHMNPLALAAWQPPPSRGPLSQQERSQIANDNASSGNPFNVAYRANRDWADTQEPQHEKKKSKILSCLSSVFSCMSIPVMAVTSVTGVGKPRRKRGGNNEEDFGPKEEDMLSEDDIKLEPEFQALSNFDRYGPVNDAFLNRMIVEAMKFINSKTDPLTSAEKREQYGHIGAVKVFMKQRKALEDKLLRQRAREAAELKESFGAKLKSKFGGPIYRTTEERGLF